MAGISFCNCNWPQPDKWDSCDNCGDEMAQDRLDAINASPTCLCYKPWPDPDYSVGPKRGLVGHPCLFCEKPDADLRLDELYRRHQEFLKSPGSILSLQEWMVVKIFICLLTLALSTSVCSYITGAF